VRADGVREYEVHPAQFGLPPAGAEAVRGGDAAQNATIIRAVLGNVQDGQGGTARRDIVAVNAAAALVASGRATDLAQGIQMANDVIQSGEALARLDAFVRMSQSLAN
jgi:anthranilate phosphoribosyltransferase